MKRLAQLALFLILFLAVGCQDRNPETASPKTAPQVESNPVPGDSQSLDPNNPMKSGSLVSGEHPTQGTVRLVTEQGRQWLELDANFQTSELGPDLVVILHRSPDVIGSTQPPAYPLQEGDYAIVAPLRQYRGTQRYLIPDSLKVADYQSVVIWCRQFNATFGAAVLR